MVISVYLGPAGSLHGIDATELTSMAAFLKSCRHPWIAVGDSNTTPERLWASGWSQAIVADVATIPGGYTCYTHNSKKGTTSASLIDYALVGHEARKYFIGLETTAAPWRAHVGQILKIRGAARPITIRQLQLPAHFAHPPAPPESPDPNSKRQSEKQRKTQADDGAHQRPSDPRQAAPEAPDIDIQYYTDLTTEMDKRWTESGSSASILPS
eukprot:9248740-Pyramimonas_sp.AAC.1